MKFYTFHQNNSGGSFIKNDKLDEFVVIEANDYKHANERATEIGLYFSGVRAGIDCDCCGDRWAEQYDEDGTESPEIYGETVDASGEKENTKIHYLGA